MSADFARVPTEGLQATHLRLLLEAAARYEDRRDAFYAHDATWSASQGATPQEQQRWAGIRFDLENAAFRAADDIVQCMDRARRAGALGELASLDVESDLRTDHFDVGVSHG